jgi:folate-binding protein YgfZ
MLSGVLSGAMPTPTAPVHGVDTGQATYSAALTPKGRMITDLRVFPLPGPDEAFLLDVPRAGARGIQEHMARSLPPRLARHADVSEQTGMLTVLGPDAAGLLADLLASEPGGPSSDRTSEREALGTRALEERITGLEELGFVRWGPLTICRTADVAGSAFDVLAGTDDLKAAWESLMRRGARPAGQALWQTLRVEAGRPEFGTDMTEDTLPPEAGIEDRAIDHAKGCYTGQEVIVRIRDRGHVNRHLRGLLFGDSPTPLAGTELFQAGDATVRGTVTSAVASPGFGQTIGLGLIRREVEPPSRLRLGAPDGPPVEVVELDPLSWRPPPPPG